MAPSHVDLSVLWVPIMPETSKLGEQMEQVGKDATESFGKGSTGLGDKIHESVSKSRDKIKDVFHRTGSDAGKSMSDAFKEETKTVEATAEDVGKASGEKVKVGFRQSAGQLGKEMVAAIGPDVKRELSARVEDVVGGAFKSVLGNDGIGGMVGDVVSKAASSGFEGWIDDLKTKVTGVKDTVNTTKQAFADLTGGKTTEGLQGLSNSFVGLNNAAKVFGVDVGDLPEPIQDVINKTAAAKLTAEGFADIFKGLPGVIGKVGTALEGLAGPLAVVAAGAETIWNGLPGIGGGLKQILAAPDPTKGFQSPVQGPPGIPVTGPLTLPPSLGGNAAGVAPPGYTAAPGSLDPFAALLPPGAAPPDLSKVPSIAPPDMPDGAIPQSFVAPPSAMPGRAAPSASRHIGSDSGLTPTSKSVKDVVASMFPQINDIGGWRPPDGFNEHSSGQALDVMIPGFGTPQGKQLGDQIRDYVMKNAKSLGVDYALWQQTQWNPDGSHSGMDNRGSPTQNHMDHVHIHTVKGGGTTDPSNMPMPSMPRQAGGTTASGDKIPTGAQHDPLFVSAAGGGAAGSDGASSSAGGDSSSLASQLGSGLLGGIAQSVGLDGSVFKTFSGASNPMDFGITKIGTGLLNWASGMMPAMSGHSPKQQQGHTYNVDQSFNVTQHGVEGNGENPYKAAMNSSNRTAALAANMP